MTQVPIAYINILCCGVLSDCGRLKMLVVTNLFDGGVDIGHLRLGYKRSAQKKKSPFILWRGITYGHVIKVQGILGFLISNAGVSGKKSGAKETPSMIFLSARESD
ncbi:hypothetical protein AVEN_56293-1 [Araneus ventricosus]|uniref:Uncharacterized protein n=1 Tax=Araneus ventricosus TaxID=182803 RepID=A0A4Y2T4M1_ARAVE|nr:hypothetical protein AVEN_56293-1 [Araneus ventricosus]